MTANSYFSVLSTVLIVLILTGCFPQERPAEPGDAPHPSTPYLQILGIAQDAGYPQIGCQKDCCQRVYAGQQHPERVTSMAVVDPTAGKSWLLDASPNLSSQWNDLQQHTATPIAGIFPTHAHMGHYTGLMFLGREAMGADGVPVYALPRMDSFLRLNGPWSQLVHLKNIQIQPLVFGQDIPLSEALSLQATQVPHRDEFSETAAFIVSGPRFKVLYLPDIDKWTKWDRSIIALIQEVDYAFIDGTFFDGSELPQRDMSEIPHPFIVESLEHFAKLAPAEKQKIYFTHFNHTNPLLDPDSEARKEVLRQGYHIAADGLQLPL